MQNLLRPESVGLEFSRQSVWSTRPLTSVRSIYLEILRVCTSQRRFQILLERREEDASLSSDKMVFARHEAERNLKRRFSQDFLLHMKFIYESRKARPRQHPASHAYTIINLHDCGRLYSRFAGKHSQYQTIITITVRGKGELWVSVCPHKSEGTLFDGR
jgi:hypothetical protein